MSTLVPETDASQPTLRRLNRAALIALAAGTVIAVTVVAPAEYGFDPTGVGRILGFTQIGEMKAGTRVDAVPAGPIAGDIVTDTPDDGKRVQFVIGPYNGREAKAVLKAGARMTYEWATDGEAVEFEFHGDPEVPKAPGDYTSYQKGRSAGAKGEFSAGFAGHHGWFWKNLTARPVVITATVKGAVESFAPIYAKGESATTAAVAPAGAGGGPSSDTTPYYTSLPMQRFMNEVMSHAANEVWKRQGYISDAEGFRSLFPKDAKEWKEAENGALSLAELTNVLLIPGRRVDEQVWTDAVAEVRQVSLKLAATARNKDENGYMEAGAQLNDACYSCHKRYAPGVD